MKKKDIEHKKYCNLNNGEEVIILGNKVIDIEDHVVELIIYTNKILEKGLIPIEDTYVMKKQEFFNKYKEVNDLMEKVSLQADFFSKSGDALEFKDLVFNCGRIDVPYLNTINK
jgi:hypothetical protein